MPDSHLVVLDDEKAFCDYVERIASQCGFNVFATTQPEALLDHIRAKPAAVIVLDLEMPGADGVEVLRDLAGTNVKAKIFIASGADERVLNTVFQLGRERGLDMVGTVRKPIRAADFRKLLDPFKPMAARVTSSALEQAIADNGLILHYQPRLDLKTRKIVGAEALIRWNHPDMGMLMPNTFIPLAEESGAIGPLTEWVANTAIRQAGVWAQQGLILNLAINISALNIQNYNFPDHFEQLCRASGVAPAAITIELTETATMRDAARLMDVLSRFRIKGFHLAIDDFGTGYSSLVQLQRLPFSELKIDKSFVMGMTTQPENAIIVNTIIGMSRNLGLADVAEGVESRDVLDALIEKNCSYAQGFHIAKPMPAEQIPAVVRENARPNGA